MKYKKVTNKNKKRMQRICLSVISNGTPEVDPLGCFVNTF